MKKRCLWVLLLVFIFQCIPGTALAMGDFWINKIAQENPADSLCLTFYLNYGYFDRDIQGFRIYDNGVMVGEATKQKTNTNNKKMYVRVNQTGVHTFTLAAYNSRGEEQINTSRKVTYRVLERPTILNINSNNGVVYLDWNPRYNAPELQNIYIIREQIAGVYQERRINRQVIDLKGIATRYTDYGVQPGTRYVYRIVLQGKNGNLSAPSLEKFIQVQGQQPRSIPRF